jgi:hypothetical protein
MEITLVEIRPVSAMRFAGLSIAQNVRLMYSSISKPQLTFPVRPLYFDIQRAEREHITDVHIHHAWRLVV